MHYKVQLNQYNIRENYIKKHYTLTCCTYNFSGLLGIVTDFQFQLYSKTAIESVVPYSCPYCSLRIDRKEPDMFIPSENDA